METIRKVYSQQKLRYENKTHQCQDRIVNLFQPNVRPIVREKDKVKTEFGTKIKIGEVNGFCRIDRFSQDAYNGSTGMKKQVENFKHTYGFYPRVLLGDQIFLTRNNSWILLPLFPKVR